MKILFRKIKVHIIFLYVGLIIKDYIKQWNKLKKKKMKLLSFWI